MNFDTYLVNDDTFLENRIPDSTRRFIELTSKYLISFEKNE